MRLLVVADAHGQAVAQRSLLEFLSREKYDLLILIGDISHLGPASVIEEFVETGRRMNIPVLAVPGNCDPKNADEVLESKGANLHKKCIKFGDFTFIGLGGSNITPFNTPLEFTENEMAEELEKLSFCVRGKFVLVTHAPPYGTTADMLPDGTHIGSKSIRTFIEKMQPLANLCGHVHEARSISFVGGTVIVNPGPLSKGFAADVKLGETTEAKLIQI